MLVVAFRPPFLSCQRSEGWPICTVSQCSSACLSYDSGDHSFNSHRVISWIKSPDKNPIAFVKFSSERNIIAMCVVLWVSLITFVSWNLLMRRLATALPSSLALKLYYVHKIRRRCVCAPYESSPHPSEYYTPKNASVSQSLFTSSFPAEMPDLPLRAASPHWFDEPNNNFVGEEYKLWSLLVSIYIFFSSFLLLFHSVGSEIFFSVPCYRTPSIYILPVG
jgi:hypothetical protein